MIMVKIEIPSSVADIITRLGRAGFEAYIVGGCVRDSLIGRPVHDWDITTNARPHDIKAVFAAARKIDIGERHGTIAVKSGKDYHEVTTYRIDGAYGDGRRPDDVSFTNDVKEDLRRRDFTINAMAYNKTAGLVDFFGGLDDVKAGVVRAVGDAFERFDEDYLRIMRAYRFAAVLGFNLDKTLRKAAKAGKQNLHNIAVERVQTEFTKILLADDFDKIEMFFEDCGDALFPEITRLLGFAQNNSYHYLDVYNHSMCVLRNTPAVITQRLAALFHDTGKYETRTTDDKGVHHFYGHPKISYNIAEKTLKHWRFDNNTIGRTLDIIKYHDVEAKPEKRLLKRLLNKLGEDLARDVLVFQIADNTAKSQLAKDYKLQDVIQAKQMLEEIIAAKEPFKTSDLAIDGRDVMEILGIAPSAAVGQHLHRLIEHVLDNPEINTREGLIGLLKDFIPSCNLNHTKAQYDFSTQKPR